MMATDKVKRSIAGLRAKASLQEANELIADALESILKEIVGAEVIKAEPEPKPKGKPKGK